MHLVTERVFPKHILFCVCMPVSLWPAFIDTLFICTVFVHPCVYASVLYSSNARYVSIFCYKLHTVKETPQTTDEEEVGAFTRLIEAMGFTGPLKYNKWVKKQPLNLVLLNNLLLNSDLFILMSPVCQNFS